MNQGLGIAWTGSLGKHVVLLSPEDSNRLEKYLPKWARYRLFIPLVALKMFPPQFRVTLISQESFNLCLVCSGEAEGEEKGG